MLMQLPWHTWQTFLSFTTHKSSVENQRTEGQNYGKLYLLIFSLSNAYSYDCIFIFVIILHKEHSIVEKISVFFSRWTLAFVTLRTK